MGCITRKRRERRNPVVVTVVEEPVPEIVEVVEETPVILPDVQETTTEGLVVTKETVLVEKISYKQPRGRKPKRYSTDPTEEEG